MSGDDLTPIIKDGKRMTVRELSEEMEKLGYGKVVDVTYPKRERSKETRP